MSATVDEIPFARDIVVILSSSTILDAFTVLVTHKLLSAPVIDVATNKYIGFFDVTDFSEYVLKVIESCGSSAESEAIPIEFCDLYDLLMTVSEFHPAVLQSVLHSINGEKFPSLPVGAPINQLLECLGSKGFHRVAIVNPNTHAVEKIISQTTFMSYLTAHPEFLHHLSSPTVESSGIGLKKNGRRVYTRPKACVALLADMKVISVPASAPAVDALKLLHEHHISGLAVVDAEGTIVTTVSSSDLRTTVSGERFRFAGISVLEFVQRSRALDGAQEKPAVVTAGPSTCLLDVFHKLAKTGLHRLYIVDGEHKPVGVVSLKDLLNYIVTVNHA